MDDAQAKALRALREFRMLSGFDRPMSEDEMKTFAQQFAKIFKDREPHPEAIQSIWDAPQTGPAPESPPTGGLAEQQPPLPLVTPVSTFATAPISTTPVSATASSTTAPLFTSLSLEESESDPEETSPQSGSSESMMSGVEYSSNQLKHQAPAGDLRGDSPAAKRFKEDTHDSSARHRSPDSPEPTVPETVEEMLSKSFKCIRTLKIINSMEEPLPVLPPDDNVLPPDLYSPDTWAPFMVETLGSYYEYELDQAVAFERGQKGSSVLGPRQLKDFCSPPRGLSSRTFNFQQCMTELQGAQQTYQSSLLRSRGLESWVWTIIEKSIESVKAKGVSGGREEQEISIKCTELVFEAVGLKFPKSYTMRVSEDERNQFDVQVGAERKTGKEASVSKQWRARNVHYFKCLDALRRHNAHWFFLTRAKGYRRKLEDLTDPESQLIPWVEQFNEFASILAHRAWSSVKGDFTGQEEVSLYKKAPETSAATWHNWQCFWATVKDMFDYNQTHPNYPEGWLSSPNASYQEGFLGNSKKNASWSIMLRESKVDHVVGHVASASCYIEVGSFIGHLPGECVYRHGQHAVAPIPSIEGPKSGLCIYEINLIGLLSFAKRTSNFDEGNVIAAWEKYSDPKARQHTSFRLILFTYRPVEILQPLVLWNHMGDGRVSPE